MKVIVIPPCPRCGAPRPWRDGFYTTRSGEKHLRLRCRVCGYAHVRRPWYETTYRVGSPYRRRADAALRTQAKAQKVWGELGQAPQKTLKALGGSIQTLQAAADTIRREFHALAAAAAPALQVVCPRCRAIETVRDGYIRGRPRRRCRACGCRYVAKARWRRVKPQPSLGL